MTEGTIHFTDGTLVHWHVEEYLPYEPQARHFDEGFIVSNDADEMTVYFISGISGLVYGPSDEDADEISQVIEGAYSPEMNARIEQAMKWEAQMPQ